MKNYTYKEIGMLIGAGIGGAISVVGFYIWSNIVFAAFTVVGITIGISIGNMLDRKYSSNTNKNELSDIK